MWLILREISEGTCADGLHGRDGLHRAGRAQQVPDHGLGAVDAHVPARQRRADRPVLRQVARLERCARFSVIL